MLAEAYNRGIAISASFLNVELGARLRLEDTSVESHSDSLSRISIISLSAVFLPTPGILTKESLSLLLTVCTNSSTLSPPDSIPNASFGPTTIYTDQ